MGCLIFEKCKIKITNNPENCLKKLFYFGIICGIIVYDIIDVMCDEGEIDLSSKEIKWEDLTGF